MSLSFYPDTVCKFFDFTAEVLKYTAQDIRMSIASRIYLSATGYTEFQVISKVFLRSETMRTIFYAPFISDRQLYAYLAEAMRSAKGQEYPEQSIIIFFDIIHGKCMAKRLENPTKSVNDRILENLGFIERIKYLHHDDHFIISKLRRVFDETEEKEEKNSNQVDGGTNQPGNPGLEVPESFKFLTSSPHLPRRQ